MPQMRRSMADVSNQATRRSARLSHEKPIYGSLKKKQSSRSMLSKIDLTSLTEKRKRDDEESDIKKMDFTQDQNSTKGESDDDMETNILSDYERKIQQNIEERQKILLGLGILDDCKELCPKKEKKTVKVLKKESIKTERPTAIRRSKRLSNAVKVSYNEDPLKTTKVEMEVEENSVENYSTCYKIYPKPGPLPLQKYYQLEDIDSSKEFLSTMVNKSFTPQDNGNNWVGDDMKVAKIFKSLDIKDDKIAKVVSRRIRSMEVHPQVDKILVFVGGNEGDLGIWNNSASGPNDSLFRYKIHASPINCMSFDMDHHKTLYTTSFDGTFRVTDLVSLQSEQVYDCSKNISNSYVSWHSQKDCNTFVIGGSKGFVDLIDLRVKDNAVASYATVTSKSVKIVRIHPVENHTMATASSDGCISIWDLRSIKKACPVVSEFLPLNIQGMEYSPITGNHLLTSCADNKIRISTVQSDRIKTVTRFYHNNNTGRWLTTFKPKWLPNSERHFTIGSMDYPRVIEVWNVDGNVVHKYSHENLQTICCLTAIHPYRNLVFGGNSSGKVYTLS